MVQVIATADQIKQYSQAHRIAIGQKMDGDHLPTSTAISKRKNPERFNDKYADTFHNFIAQKEGHDINDLTVVIPENINIEGINFDYFDFAFIKFENAQPFVSQIHNNHMDFYCCDLFNLNMAGLDLRNTNLKDARLYGTDLRGVRIEDTSTFSRFLRRVNLEGTHLENANLKNREISNAKLKGVHLAGADLTRTLLFDSDLTDADLRGANLIRANLIRANLTRADLWNADLDGTDLTDANLRNADLQGVRNFNVDKLLAFDKQLVEGVKITPQQIENAYDALPIKGKPTLDDYAQLFIDNGIEIIDRDRQKSTRKGEVVADAEAKAPPSSKLEEPEAEPAVSQRGIGGHGV